MYLSFIPDALPLVRQGVGLGLWVMKEETGLIIWQLLLVRVKGIS